MFQQYFDNVAKFTAQDARDAYAHKLEDELSFCLSEIKRVMKSEKSVTIFKRLEVEIQAELKERGFKVTFNQGYDQRDVDSYTISWGI